MMHNEYVLQVAKWHIVEEVLHEVRSPATPQVNFQLNSADLWAFRWSSVERAVDDAVIDVTKGFLTFDDEPSNIEPDHPSLDKFLNGWNDVSR